MSLQPYKVTLVVSALDYDDDGNIVGERASEPLTLYGIEQLRTWLDGYEAEHFTADGQPAP